MRWLLGAISTNSSTKSISSVTAITNWNINRRHHEAMSVLTGTSTVEQVAARAKGIIDGWFTSPEQVLAQGGGSNTVDGAGPLNIGTVLATTVTIGRSGQSQKLGAFVTVDQNGYVQLTSNGGIDSTGTMLIGPTGATTISIGRTGQLINFVAALVALGGGASATLGTIGGSGPATAGQNAWWAVQNAGVAGWVPIWH
jgi:hypothetical protein